MHRIVGSFTFAVTLRVIARNAKPSDAVIARTAKPSDAEALTKLLKNFGCEFHP